MRFAIAATISWISSPPIRTDARAAKNFAGLRMRQQFHKTVLRTHEERFAMVVERIARGEKFCPARFRRFFRQPDRCHLRIGEHDRKQQAIIQPARFFWLDHIVRRDFSLRHGDVNDVMRPGAITRRKNVRRAGLHPGVCDDAAIVGFHARFF